MERKHVVRTPDVTGNYAFAGLSVMVSSILAEWARSGFRDKKEEVIEVLLSFLISISKTMIK